MTFFFNINFMQNSFSRYYYASLDSARKQVADLIESKEWNFDEFGDRKQALLKALNIKNDDIKDKEDDTINDNR